MGKTGRLQENKRTQAAVLGPTPLSEIRKDLASSTATVRKNDRSSRPHRFWISASTFLITNDLVLASPPDLMAAAMLAGRALLTDSQSGKRFFKFSKARSLFTSVVDCERIVSTSSSSGSFEPWLRGMPWVASRFCVTYLARNRFSTTSSEVIEEAGDFDLIIIVESARGPRP